MAETVSAGVAVPLGLRVEVPVIAMVLVAETLADAVAVGVGEAGGSSRAKRVPLVLITSSLPSAVITTFGVIEPPLPLPPSLPMANCHRSDPLEASTAPAEPLSLGELSTTRARNP